jgi:hypothetical protein
MFARGTRLFLVSGAAALLALITVIPYRIVQGGYLTDVSGVWAALADDVAHGLLYRPLVSELGYGGTRYFPLHPLLHGVLAAIGIPLRAAGHLLSLASACLLVYAGARALKNRGASNVVAYSAGVLSLATRTAFVAIAGIRGDILPLSLGVLGLALIPKDSKGSWLPAGVAFSFAVLAKPTLLWAPAGAFLALIVAREFKAAAQLTVVTAGVVAAGLFGTYFASNGEIITSFKACAGGGGFGLSYLIGFLPLVRPGEWAWLLGGVALTLLRGKDGLKDPLGASVLVCLFVMAVLHMSRGLHTNHLIDVTALGTLAVASAIVDAGTRRIPRYVFGVAAALGLADAILLEGMVLKRGELDRAAAALPPGNAPVLSEQGWIPLLAGERAVVLDAYSIVQTRKNEPEIGRDLLGRLDRCAYRAVVLIGKAETAGPVWYDSIRFGPGFADHLLSHYYFDKVAGAHAIYLPRCGLASVPQASGPDDTDTVLNRGGAPSRVRLLLRSILSIFDRSGR